MAILLGDSGRSRPYTPRSRIGSFALHGSGSRCPRLPESTQPCSVGNVRDGPTCSRRRCERRFANVASDFVGSAPVDPVNRDTTPAAAVGTDSTIRDPATMDLRDRPEDEAFRKEVRAWLSDHVVGEFAALGGRGGSGDETFGFETRSAWEKVLAADGWTCIGWPVEHGGRGASIDQQVIFNEEYVRARGPGAGQRHGRGAARPDPDPLRHRPSSRPGSSRPSWPAPSCGARATRSPTPAATWPTSRPGPQLDGDEWVVTGQKVWTSLAHQADWCFVVCRTEPGSARHQGPVLSPGAHGPARRRGPAHHPADPDLASSTRSSSTGPAPGPTTSWARWARDGGWPWPPWPSSGASALLGHQLVLPAGARPSPGAGQENGAAPRPGRAPAPGPGSYVELDDPALQHAAQPRRASTARWPRPRPPSPSCTGAAGTAGSASWPSTSWARRPASVAAGVRRLRARRVPAHLPLQPAPRPSTAAPTRSRSNIIGERVLGLPPEPKGTA